MVKISRRASFAVLVIMFLGLQTLPSLANPGLQHLGAVMQTPVDDEVLDLTEADVPPYRPALRGRGTVKPIGQKTIVANGTAITARGPNTRGAKKSCQSAVTGPFGSSSSLVDATYCQLLLRLPEKDGLLYWGRELDNGLALVRMVSTVQSSEEYQAANSYSLLDTLNSVTLSDERAALVKPVDGETAGDQVATDQVAVNKERAAEKKAQEDAERRAADAARRAEAKRREATLMKRTPMSTKQFEKFVSNRKFARTEYLTPSMVYGAYSTNSQKVRVLLVHLSGSKGFSVSPGDRGRAEVGTWAAEIGAQGAINGNWFGPYDGPAVSNGNVYAGDDHNYTSLFGITAQKDLIMDHHSQVNAKVDSRIAFGVSGHPTLIYKGRRIDDFNGDTAFTGRAPRTAIGANKEGDVLIFVTVDGRSSTAIGMTGLETANLMVKLGASNAVMLDGGGSTTMWISDRGVVNRPSGGSPRAVANQIAIFGS